MKTNVDEYGVPCTVTFFCHVLKKVDTNTIATFFFFSFHIFLLLSSETVDSIDFYAAS